MEKLKKDFSYVLLIVICGMLLTSCASIEKDVHKTPSVEDQILINAERTKELQQEVFAKALNALAGFTTPKGVSILSVSDTMPDTDDPAAIESYIDQLDAISNNLSADEQQQLNAQLQELTAYYESQMPPEIEHAFEDRVPAGMYETKDSIIIGDDIIIDKNSPDNAVLISNLIRSEKGLPYVVNSNNQAQLNGIYRTGNFGDNILWSEGEVNYRFSDKNELSASEKTFVLNCMSDWTKSSASKVTFTELSSTLWRKFLWSIGLSKHVLIEKKDLVAGASGQSKVGRVAWATMAIDSEFTDDIRTVRHELGHVLGLLHEHQRPDRDNYIKVKWDNVIGFTGSFEKLDESWGKKITNTKEYDYKSIMHYKNYEFFTDLTGNYIETGGDLITPLDAAFIQTLYQ